MSSLVVSPSLLRDVMGGGVVFCRYGVASAIGGVAICQRLGSRSGPNHLWLWSIVNDDDLLGKTVFVEVVPVGFPRPSPLPHRLGVGRGGLCSGDGHG